MSNPQIMRSISIAAPAAQVWDAISDPAHMAAWFLPPALGAQMKAESGKLYVTMGPMGIPIATLDKLSPPRQLSMRGFPDGVLTATLTVEPDNDATRVTVTMTGFEALPADAQQERVAPSTAGWEKALENLQAYLESKQLPFPQGYVAALLGYRSESKSRFAIERSVWINAPRERVWQALTDAEYVQKWFSPNTAWRVSEFKVGGHLYSPDPETGAERYTQIFDVIDPPNQLITHSAPHASEPVQVTTYSLQAENGGTRLNLTHSGYELQPADVRYNSLEQNAFGFGMMLENIKASVEGTDLPYPFGF